MTAGRPYQIVVAGPAAAAIAEDLPEAVAAAVVELITGPLPDNPRRVGVPLRDELEGLWSARRGTYRVLYGIDDTAQEVVVLRVSHRSLRLLLRHNSRPGMPGG